MVIPNKQKRNGAMLNQGCPQESGHDLIYGHSKLSLDDANIKLKFDPIYL
jgi:hypothetical protein